MFSFWTRTRSNRTGSNSDPMYIKVEFECSYFEIVHFTVIPTFSWTYIDIYKTTKVNVVNLKKNV